MFERRQSRKTVGIQLAVRTIVEAENVASCGEAIRSAGRRIALGASGDRRDARDQPLRGSGTPVTRNERPHDDALSQCLRGGNDPGITKAEGRPKPLRGRAGGGLDGEIAAAKLDGDLIRLQPEEIGMSVSVIADDVAPRGGFLQKVGAFPSVLADDENSGARFVEIEKIEQFRRDLGIRAVVERESQLARRVRAANGPAKELRARVK